MYRSHVARLHCPACAGALELVAFAEERAWVVDGYLRCGACDTAYPIIDGLPRMLTLAQLQALVPATILRDYSDRHGESFPAALRPLRADLRGQQGKDIDTANYYAWMWQHYDTRFDEGDRAELVRLTDGKPAPELVAGADVVDVGGGQGRFVVSLLEKGARSVVCLDLGEAIALACHKFRDDERVLCVQADLYRPPFGAQFDLVHCIGVLQHLPDPARGFAQLFALARPGGHILAWCYGDSRIKPLVVGIRKLCNALPIPWLWRLAGALGGVRYALSAAGTELRKRGMGAVADHLPLAMYQGYSFDYLRVNTFDHLSAQIINFFRREDLEAWMRVVGPSSHTLSERFPGRAASSWLIEAAR